MSGGIDQSPTFVRKSVRDNLQYDRMSPLEPSAVDLAGRRLGAIC